ncbi:MAG: hypothetical protein ABSD99_02520 [Candidatus Bathyarchaeia archaeon]
MIFKRRCGRWGELVVRRTVAFGFLLLIILAALPMVLPVQAFRKNPPPFLSCFAAVGTDPHGVTYIAYFYRRAAAIRMAAVWAAQGWTGIIITAC